MSTETLTTYQVALNEDSYVPMTREQIASTYATGVINENTRVWREGLADWEPMKQLSAELNIEIKPTALPVKPVHKPLRPHKGTIEPVARPTRIEHGGMPGYAGQTPQLVTNMVDEDGRPVFKVVRSKSRAAFVIFALLFGSVGVHNFYAGYIWTGVFQALVSICFWPMALFMWLLAVIEAIFTVKDASGRRMK